MNKMKKTRKTVIISLMLSISLLSIAALASVDHIINTIAAQGGMNAGTQGDCINCSGCNKQPNIAHYQDSCFGGTWQKYSVTEAVAPRDAQEGFLGYGYVGIDDPNNIVIEGNYNNYLLNNNLTTSNLPAITGGNVTGCADLGGYYYRSALLDFSNDNRGISHYNGVQVGLLPAGKYYGIGTNPPGVTYRYNPEVSGLALQEVKAKYDTARKKYEERGLTLPDWNSVSWFCYNDAWEGAEFYSTSSVQIEGGPINQTSDRDGETTATMSYNTQQYVNVWFWHALWYLNEQGDTQATYPQVDSSWTSKQTMPTEKATGGNTWTLDGKPNKDPGIANPENGRQLGKTKVKICIQTKDGDGELTKCDEDTDVTIAPGETKTICHQINYNHKNIAFAAESEESNTLKVESYDGEGDSRACLTIVNSFESNYEVAQHTGKGFWSVASIYVKAQNDDVPEFGTAPATEKTISPIHSDMNGDGKVELTFSTDAENTEVTFWHNMFYDKITWDTKAQPKYTDHDEFVTDICSNWQVSGDVTGSSGKFCTNKAGGNSGKRIENAKTVTVRLGLNEQQTVCSRNDHDAKTVTIRQEKVTVTDKDDPKYPFYYKDYEQSRSGTGFSEACVTIYRPDDPKEGNNLGSKSHEGIADSTLMYAGETAKINWTTQATPHSTRRLNRYRAVAYLVPASINYSAATDMGLQGNLSDRMPIGSGGYPNQGRVNTDPCTYAQDLWNGVWCDVVPDSSNKTDETLNGSTSPHSYSGGEKEIVVPDYTGYKYCNTSGYQWEYYYQIAQNGSGAWVKYSEGEYTNKVPIYWTNYSSACRTIAKKPEVAFWNGGVKASGSIMTSLYTRYTPNPSDEQRRPALSGSGSTYRYGSWTEYLANPFGPLKGFASGAALSPHHFVNGNTQLYPHLSYLTISNTSDANLGKSQIATNSTLLTRLALYLDGSKTFATDSITSLYNIDWSHNNGKPKIFNVDSGINITDNIEIPDGPYTDIYQIPRLIIYTNGDVNISRTVTRIDAWIIAPNGTVNTCSDFTSAQTETRTADNHYGGATDCDRQLKINGPVIAGGVQLNRTYGADPVSYREGSYPDEVETRAVESDRYHPAEIFNLGADDYLWAYAQAGRYNSSYTDAYTRELPPRY